MTTTYAAQPIYKKMRSSAPEEETQAMTIARYHEEVQKWQEGQTPYGQKAAPDENAKAAAIAATKERAAQAKEAAQQRAEVSQAQALKRLEERRKADRTSKIAGRATGFLPAQWRKP